MATLDTDRAFAGTSTGRLTRALTGLFGTLSAWNDARVTRKSLSRLTARELDDIGLTRADIDLIALRGTRV